MALMHYLSQIHDIQITFNVRQRKPTTLDEAVSATLELESYLQPKLSISKVTKNHVETEEAVAAVSQDSTAVMMKQLLERMEKMEAELMTRKKEETDMAPERERRWLQQYRNQGGSQLGRRRVVTCGTVAKVDISLSRVLVPAPGTYLDLIDDDDDAYIPQEHNPPTTGAASSTQSSVPCYPSCIHHLPDRCGFSLAL